MVARVYNNTIDLDIIDLGSVFSRAKGTNFADSFDMSKNPAVSMASAAPGVDNTVTLTNLLPNQTFHFDKPTAVNNLNMQGPEVENVSTEAGRSNVMAVQQDYQSLNQQVMGMFQDAMVDALGHEAGSKLAGQIFPTDGPGKGQAVLTMVDPTGIGGSLYYAKGQIEAEMDRIGNADVLMQLSETIGAIQAAYDTHESGGQPPFTIVPELDPTALTPENMLAFIQRDVSQDPIMRETNEALATYDKIDEQQGLYTALNVVSDDRVMQAIEQGDLGGIAKLSDDGPQDVLDKYRTAGEVVTFSDSLGDVSGVSVDQVPHMAGMGPSSFVLASLQPAAMDSGLNPEDELLEMAMGHQSY